MWYKTRMKISLSFVLLVCAAFAQDLTSMQTGLSFNGRYWSTLTTESKMAFVVGVIEGIGAVPMHAPDDCQCALKATTGTMKALYGEKSLYIETVQEVDNFYKEPANRRITIVDAMAYGARRLEGASKKELDEMEESLRKAINQ